MQRCRESPPARSHSPSLTHTEGDGPSRLACMDTGRHSKARTINVSFWPPKPKLLLRHVRTFAGRAWLGT